MASKENLGTVFKLTDGKLAIRAHNANVPDSDYFVVDPQNTGWYVDNGAGTPDIEKGERVVTGPAPEPEQPEQPPAPPMMAAAAESKAAAK